MTVVDLPYFSQFASRELVADFVTNVRRAEDDPLWADSGASTPEEYAWWAWRTCGIACLRMVLGRRGGDVPAPVQLATECTAHGGYVRRPDGSLHGLVYAPFVEWVGRAYDVKAEVVPKLSVPDLVRWLDDGHPVMVSVHPWVRSPDRTVPTRGGHLVMAVGHDDGVLLHNPSGLYGESQEYAQVPWPRFRDVFAGRGVVFYP